MKQGRETLTVLLLEVEGQLVGIDVAEVERIVPSTGQHPLPDLPVRSLAGWLGLPEPAQAPAWLLLGRQQGLAVDRPHDLVDLPLAEIFSLPLLIRRTLPASPLWAVAHGPQGLLLLAHLALTPGPCPPGQAGSESPGGAPV